MRSFLKIQIDGFSSICFNFFVTIIVKDRCSFQKIFFYLLIDSIYHKTNSINSLLAIPKQDNKNDLRKDGRNTQDH